MRQRRSPLKHGSDVVDLILATHRYKTLGLLQVVDQFLVVKDGGPVGFGELLEQTRLELIKDDLELILLFHKFLLFDLELVLLHVDDHCQQLVLETALRDDEVDDGTLGCDFGAEVRVGKLGHEVELEFRIVVDDLSTKLQ